MLAFLPLEGSGAPQSKGIGRSLLFSSPTKESQCRGCSGDSTHVSGTQEKESHSSEKGFPWSLKNPDIGINRQGVLLAQSLCEPQPTLQAPLLKVKAHP